MSKHWQTSRRRGSGASFRRSQSMLGSGLSVALLTLHCGRTESTDLRFQEKHCGEVSDVTEPDASLGTISASLKGVAFQHSNGGLGVTLAPVIDVDDASIVPIDRTQLTLDVDVSVVSNSTGPISPENPAAADVVFIVDTTKYMALAIEGTAWGARILRDLTIDSGGDIQFGGIEFGDGIRTHIDVGPLEALESWLATLVPIGGGDDPNSALDAILEVDRTFSFRSNAVRHLVVISANGYHESSDGSGCSDVSLEELQVRMRPHTLLSLVHLGAGVRSGLRPERVAHALGAFYTHTGTLVLPWFNVAQHVPLIDLVTAGVTGNVEVPANLETVESVRASYDLGGESVTSSFDVAW